MKPKITKDKADLFQIPLERVIDLEHPLVQLSREFDWEGIRGEIAVNFCDGNGRPGSDTRVVLGLMYLKSAYSLSDEQLLERWVENPYWQWFCGYKTMQYQAPIDPTTLSRWRTRLGAEKLDGHKAVLQDDTGLGEIGEKRRYRTEAELCSDKQAVADDAEPLCPRQAVQAVEDV
jgi:IS5 family transposase